MKYLLFIFTVIVLDSISFCVRRSHEPDYYMNVRENGVVLEDQQGSIGVITVSSNTQWNIGTVCDWLKVYPSSGKGDAKITVTALTSNESTSRRYCTINITGKGTVEQQVYVCQESSPYYLFVSPNGVLLENQQGSNALIVVTSNSQWNIDTDCDWLEVAPSSGKGDAEITVTALTSNESTSVRAGIITISSSYTQKEQIPIYQEGKVPTDN